MSSGAVKVRHLGYAEARARVLDGLAPLPSESCPLDDARGRAPSSDIVAAHPLPPFVNSSMDGYAVRATDLARASADRPLELPVVGVIPAGHVATRPLRDGEAMRLMTGALLPDGADAVLAFEDVERLDTPGAPERVRIGRPALPRENVREAGADLAAGECAVARGRELSPHDLALLAALGVAEVTVGARPRVILLSTGDELLDVGDALVPGAIRDSNVPLLRALVAEAGGRVLRAERIADDPDAVVAAIRAARSEADVVLTIGGVSAGDFDPVKQALDALGEVELWRVAMKPGRPQAYGRPGGRLFFGLPGNPASVSCVFEVLVRPALRRLQGFTALDRPRIPVRLAVAVDSRAGRTDFVRVTFAWRDGEAWATPAGAQISGHLTPQARAHALLVIPELLPRLEVGDRAEALLLRAPDSAT